MALITRYDDVEQGSEAWHVAREGGVTTGTSAYRLLDHQRATRIVNGQASLYAHTESSEFTGNFYTARGHLLEDEALELYERIYKVTLHRTGYVTNSDYPQCLYSPDALDDDNIYVVEVKCFREDRHLSIVKTGKIPLKIRAQVQFGMMICGFKRARIVFYHPKVELQYKLKIFEVMANPLTQRQFKLALGVKA